MQAPKKRRLADVDPSAVNPLTFAVSQRDTSTMQMVKDAIEHRQVLLAFQPIVRADRPNQVAFYEGLIRVLDDTGRVIPAKDFMSSVEANDLGRQLDVIALNQGLRALHRNPSLRLSINMSARSIGYRRWMRTLDRWLAKDATVGERLIMEVTESSAMMVPEIVIDFMDSLQEKGICFAMDDFGAGHTAIRHFKDFYFDMVKIDGQFARGIAQNPDNRALTAALVSIAHHFDMLTVAECVECAEDARALIDLGVDCLQGYYFGAPTTRPSWLRNQPEMVSA